MQQETKQTEKTVVNILLVLIDSLTCSPDVLMVLIYLGHERSLRTSKQKHHENITIQLILYFENHLVSNIIEHLYGRLFCERLYEWSTTSVGLTRPDFSTSSI